MKPYQKTLMHVIEHFGDGALGQVAEMYLDNEIKGIGYIKELQQEVLYDTKHFKKAWGDKLVADLLTFTGAPMPGRQYNSTN